MKKVFHEVLNHPELSNESVQYLLWLEHNNYQLDSYKWLTSNVQLLALLHHTNEEEELITIFKSILSLEQFKKIIRSEHEFYSFLNFSNVVLIKNGQ